MGDRDFSISKGHAYGFSKKVHFRKEYLEAFLNKHFRILNFSTGRSIWTRINTFLYELFMRGRRELFPLSESARLEREKKDTADKQERFM